jgi:hypothetical protein
MGGIAAVLGRLADWTSIDFVYKACSFLPAISVLTAPLPNEVGQAASPTIAIRPGTLHREIGCGRGRHIRALHTRLSSARYRDGGG